MKCDLLLSTDICKNILAVLYPWFVGQTSWTHEGILNLNNVIVNGHFRWKFIIKSLHTLAAWLVGNCGFSGLTDEVSPVVEADGVE